MKTWKCLQNKILLQLPKGSSDLFVKIYDNDTLKNLYHVRI